MELTGTPRARRAAPFLVVVSGLLIAYFTLRPAGGGPQSAIPGGYLASDVILNIILFVPLGIGLGLAGVRPRTAALVGGLASAAIELAQLVVVPGRFASIHDIITNTSGTVIGALLVAGWAGRARWWRSLAPLAAGTVIVLWIGGGFLLRASLPGPRWYGQWAHDFERVETFRGRVLSYSMRGMAVGDGRIEDKTGALRAPLTRADTLVHRATVVTGTPTGGRAQIVAVVAGRRGEIASIWEDGTAITARQRLRLSDAGLRTPWIRLEQGLPPRSGDTVHIEFAVTSGGMRLSAETSAGRVESRLRATPDLFWSAFLPGEYQGGAGRRWWPLVPAVLTCGMLGLAIGARPASLALAVSAILLTGPLLAGGAFPDLPLVLTALVGTAGGGWFSSLLGLGKREGPPRPEAAPGRGEPRG